MFTVVTKTTGIELQPKCLFWNGNRLWLLSICLLPVSLLKRNLGELGYGGNLFTTCNKYTRVISSQVLLMSMSKVHTSHFIGAGAMGNLFSFKQMAKIKKQLKDLSCVFCCLCICLKIYVHWPWSERDWKRNHTSKDPRQQQPYRN